MPRPYLAEQFQPVNGPHRLISESKFASQIDEKVLRDLRQYAKESERSISRIVTEAVESYLQRERVRPAFRAAAEAVLDEHEELLRRLAK